eukprot:COSAG06_NODE_60855_length_269_cov_1.070588_1_plen_34_part_10
MTYLRFRFLLVLFVVVVFVAVNDVERGIMGGSLD